MQMGKMAIAIDDNCSEGYKALGLSYHYKGQEDKALDSYYKAVKINPNNEMATSNIESVFTLLSQAGSLNQFLFSTSNRASMHCMMFSK